MSPKEQSWHVGIALLILISSPSIAAKLSTLESAPGGDRPVRVVEEINNGLFTSDFPSTALFIVNAGASIGDCTATLIGCQTALTAAHCVCPPGSNGSSCVPLSPPGLLFFQHSGFYGISSVAVHPGWVSPGGALGRHDLAVLRLSAPVAGVQPTPLNLAAKPANGTQALLAGFGTTSSRPAGVKRAGLAVLTACDDPGAIALCYDFEAPVGPPGQDSTGCPGDSGGPLFTVQGGGLVLSGATSGGQGPGASNCTVPVQGVYSDVFADRAWIQAQAAGDLGQASCGGLPNAGSAAAPYGGAAAILSASTPVANFTFEVPVNTTGFNVMLSAESYLVNDFDLYLRRGAPPTGTTFDCSSELAGSLERCFVASPQPGTWHIAVSRFDGEGIYQVTATAYTAGGSGTVPCVRNTTTACLANDRFEVKVDWQTSTASGPAQVMAFGGQRAENSDSAFFWFFSEANFEMGLKILDACGFNGKFWVFVSGLTDQGWTVRIRDTHTGDVKTYSNPTGRLTPTTADTAAISCN